MTSYLHHPADAVALADALAQATQILVDATDESRGGAVVEQIPYVPGVTSDIPDFPKIVLGSAACLAAYAWAAYEFGQVINWNVSKFRVLIRVCTNPLWCQFRMGVRNLLCKRDADSVP